MHTKKLISLVLITSMLAGCNPPPPGAGQDTGGISKQDIGMVSGGLAGGLLGSMIGRGNGRLVATAGGAILGGLAGSSIGHSLDQADAAYANRRAQQAFETGQPGQPMQWQNPQNGHSGTITPNAPYQMANGQYCREFTQTIVVAGQQQQGYGTACRQSDGTWKIVSNN